MQNNCKGDSLRERVEVKGCSRAAGVREGHPGQGRTPDQDLHDVKTVVHKELEAELPKHRTQRTQARGERSLMAMWNRKGKVGMRRNT